MSQQIFDKLKNAIETLDADAAKAAAVEAVAAKVPVAEAIEKGLATGMETVSAAFDEGEMFIPQLILAGKAFEAAIAELTGNMSDAEKQQTSKGKIIVHTVQGDIHSIGKNIVATMMGANGFEVFDLGVDVPVDTVVAKAEELGVDIILGSALMTTTMPAERDIMNLLREKGIRDKYFTMFGGAPCSAEWCKEIGADAFSDTATDAVRVAMDLMKKKGA